MSEMLMLGMGELLVIFADMKDGHELCGPRLGMGLQGSRQCALGTLGPSGGAVCAESLYPMCRYLGRCCWELSPWEGQLPRTKTMAELLSYMPLLLFFF